jgi:diguanylate cyclase (GGDEF)-like protein/putative nucleotidyltransferase with HDIG domain
VPVLGLPRLGRSYVSAVIVAGSLVIGHSLYQLYREPIGYQWFLLAALTLISGSATVKLPSSFASISISETFVFTAVLLYGPAAGTLIVTLDGLVISFWLAKRHREGHRALFNMSAPAISAWCSAQLFFLASGIAPLVKQPATLNQILPALVLFALTYFVINSWLIAFVISIERHLKPFEVWRRHFVWLSLNYFCGASVAVLLVFYNRQIDIGYIAVIVPLLLVLYFTFKTAMARVEDADRYIDQLNRLYLSTVETLAMAIDAKDQITHGHIRRVQLYAVGLAKHVGVGDEQLIKAIEAAALLHDMGKLAVPEYILNKPGKLSDIEFEKMKLHASVGADILSAIPFPYPVVPIVRHHHENWDGTGYPTGIKGTTIPIGARILSVVDCFDALTSDRPYRPRLPDDEALRILQERRGTMYDPLVVDTFIRVHREIAPTPTVEAAQPKALSEIASARRSTVAVSPPSRLDDIAASADEMLTLYELARALGGQASVTDTADVITKHLRRLIPASLCIFFAYNSRTDEIEAQFAVGDTSPVVRGLRIGLGQRLSGWVAANRQTVMNSDPTLDLGDVARSASPRLRSCLSTPLVADDELIGVLSLYSNTIDGFNDDHRRIIEVVARHVSITFKRAAEFDSLSHRDILTGLPSWAALEQFVSAARIQQLTRDSSLTLLFIDVPNLKRIITLHGSAVRDDVLGQVVRHARSALRVADILFRYSSDEFVALLNDTSYDRADAVAVRIRNAFNDNPLVLQTAGEIRVGIEVTTACAPRDGSSLADLIAAARLRSAADRSESTVH